MTTRATPVRFRLYPEERSRLYIVVHVWPTARAMRRTFGGRREPRVDGYCHPYTVQRIAADGTWRTLPVVADVHFYRQRLSMEVVTHELFHATIAWARRIRFDFCRLGADDAINADEERITYAHGRLCRGFMSRAERLRLYGDGMAAA